MSIISSMYKTLQPGMSHYHIVPFDKEKKTGFKVTSTKTEEC